MESNLSSELIPGYMLPVLGRAMPVAAFLSVLFTASVLARQSTRPVLMWGFAAPFAVTAAAVVMADLHALYAGGYLGHCLLASGVLLLVAASISVSGGSRR